MSTLVKFERFINQHETSHDWLCQQELLRRQGLIEIRLHDVTRYIHEYYTHLGLLFYIYLRYIHLSNSTTDFHVLWPKRRYVIQRDAFEDHTDTIHHLGVHFLS